MWFSTEKYRGHGILLEELVVALPLKAVWGKVLRTNTAVLGGLKVFSPDSRFPFFTKAGSSQWKPEKKISLSSLTSLKNKTSKPKIPFISLIMFNLSY